LEEFSLRSGKHPHGSLRIVLSVILKSSVVVCV